MAAPAAMLRKLRVKFIVLNMALAALVLGVSFAAICVADYQSTMDEVRQTLIEAVSHTGRGPRNAMDHGPLPLDNTWAQQEQSTDSDSAASDENAADDDMQDWAPPIIGGEGENTLPVAVYYVTSTSIVQAIERSSATVPEDLLLEAFPTVLASSEEWGYLPEENLYFAQNSEGRDYVIAFADGSVADGWQTLAFMLGIIGLGALVVLLALNLLFSRWALRPVQHAWNQQQQFVADASHELKTPLTVILANNAILRQHGNETIASQGQWIESTQMEAERMQGLVTDMLDLARSDTLEDNGEKKAVNFSKLVEGEVLTFESVAFEKGLAWESSLAAGVTVTGDDRRLQRLVAVLLDNACKYTDPGGLIDVALTADERAALLTVRNTGEPIPADDLAHLFDRFYRADKARTHSADDAPAGYGLGLAIAQDIAQVHKGTLTVTSTAAEGTTFTLRLPLA